MRFNPMSVVPLCRRDTLVAKQPGNCSDRDIMLQQSNGERVSEPMRMHIDAGFAPYRVESPAKTLDARFKITVTRPAPEEVIFAFNRHFQQRVNCGLAQSECDIFAGLERSNYKPAGFKVQARTFEYGSVRNSEAGVQQQQNQALRSKSVPFVPVERFTRVQNGLDFRLFERQSSRRVILHLLHDCGRILSHPVSIFAVPAEAPERFQFLAQRFATRRCRGNGTVAFPSSRTFQLGLTIGNVVLLSFTRSAGPKSGHKIYRNTRSAKTMVPVAMHNKRSKSIFVAGNGGMLKAPGPAIRQIIRQGFFQGFVFALVGQFRHERAGKLPLCPGPIAGPHGLSRSLAVDEFVTPDRAATLGSLAALSGLGTGRSVPSPEKNVSHSFGYYQKCWHKIGTVQNQPCNLLILNDLTWGGWWGLNPRHPEPQSGATTN